MNGLPPSPGEGDGVGEGVGLGDGVGDEGPEGPEASVTAGDEEGPAAPAWRK